MVDLVTLPEHITPAWMTSALRESGALPAGEVTAVRTALIGTGKMGDNARIELAYDGDYNAPSSLVAKLPATDPTARAAASGMGLYLSLIHI